MKRKIIPISPEYLYYHFVARERKEKLLTELPDDIHYIGSYTDHVNGTIYLVVESDEFEDVEIGAMMPELELQYQEIE